VSAIGIDALRHVRRPAERLLASIPVVLGVHQLVEVFVWWGLEDRVVSQFSREAMWIYLVIAFSVFPVLVPLAVGALEPVSNRRRIQLFTTIGALVAATLMYSVIRGPVSAVVERHHIAYSVNLWHGGILVTLYVLATCGSLLASHHRRVRWFGAVNVVAVASLAVLDRTAVVSLWYAWAAVTSLSIAIHLRVGEQESRTGSLAV
jgi:hypothetical protein